MSEYISREAVLKHLNECKEDPFFDPDMARICFAISIFIEEMQAADVQPVVRCKDCIYLNRHDCPMAYIEHQTLQFAAVTPDFYCAKGADHEP
ncbi:hypothetical protein [Ruminococcus flavefaciens]|uniref:Uncharacterized protein n=1 Tax=Ruminococcus flavefaciens TaxID=1265 RepID=A0A315Y1U7_RUMFL|nr:hypothetical protein [Ruminococcus flavefaciens]PWJ13987.1 hypothetical protein IE37_00918 [Ruminococcus flavefaciens]SSA43579.1 hypothetical protein SAMN02910325_00918 [Ruminococcus flavefaciens]